MASKKITELDELITAGDDDVLAIVQSGVTKKIKKSNLITTSGLGSETPTGDVDGSNNSYTVLNEPLFIIVDGSARVPGFGYTYSGGVITVDVLAPPVSFIRSMY